MQLPELRTSLQTTSRDCLQLLGALEQHKHQYPGSGSAEKRKQRTLPCYGIGGWKGLTSKAVFLRAWVTQADSWGMPAAAQPGHAPQIQKAASPALSLGALGCSLLSLALAASGEPHNTHLTLLQRPQLFSPDWNCTCPLTHPALLSTSLLTKADTSSVSFSSFPSSWLWGSSLLYYLWCCSAKARNEGGLHSKRATSFPWKVCTILTPRVCFLLQTNNFHDTWYV